MSDYQWKYGRRALITDHWGYFIDNHEVLQPLSNEVIGKLMDAHLSDDGTITDIQIVFKLMELGLIKTVRHITRNWYDITLNEKGHALIWDCFGRYYIWQHDPTRIIEAATGNIWQHWQDHELNAATVRMQATPQPAPDSKE